MTVFGPKKLSVDNTVWASVDSVTIMIATGRTMSDQNWRTLLTEATQLGTERKIPQRASVAFYGWMITATQRRIAAEHVAEQKVVMLKHAVLTESAVVRGALLALGWLLPNLSMQAFSPNDIASASRFIAPIAPHSTSELVVTVRESLRLAGHRPEAEISASDRQS